jgi:hypothetical protein
MRVRILKTKKREEEKGGKMIRHREMWRTRRIEKQGLRNRGEARKIRKRTRGMK